MKIWIKLAGIALFMIAALYIMGKVAMEAGQ